MSNVLEKIRSEYKAKFPIRDGFTCEQQIAMALLHNCDVIGKGWQSILVIIPKPTMRALAKEGIIDERGRLTKSGNEFLKRWAGYSQ